MKEVPNFPNYFTTEDGEIYSTKRGGLYQLKPMIDTSGYKRVALHREGRQFTRRVHRLVLETFVGPRPKGMECCHGQRGTLDNSLTNLEWGTSKKNNGPDMIRDGTRSRGERQGNSKLNELQVRIIRRLTSEMPLRIVAEIFNISVGHTSYIQSRKKWAWLE